MSEIIKQSMANIWASIGDVVVPDVEKIAEGWLVEVVPRQYWNWMQNRTDTNLAYLFQHGIPEWDETVEYIVNKSYVTYADVVYIAILTGTNQNPTSATTYWKVAFATSTAALEALKAVTPAADKLPYFSSTTTATTTTITPLARTLLDDTTQGEMLTTVGAQAADATLTALAGVTTATNKLAYFTGVDTATTTDLTAFGRSLIDDADAAAARATLVLDNVDNTSDAAKPVSVAQQAALDLKAPLLSPTLTGVPTTPTAAVGTSTTQVASTAFVNAEIAADRPYSVTATDIKMDGVQSLGSLATIPRADHVHPSDSSKLSLSGGAMTGTIDNSHPTLMKGTQGSVVRGYIQGDANGFGILSSLGQWAARAPFGTNDWLVTGTCTAAAFTGPLNGAATTLSGDQSNWASLRSSAIANMLGWKNYGDGHVIFDASAGTAPNGTAINNSNANGAWVATYPTLMGWNGSTTYGVRVDSARIADVLPDTGWLVPTLVNGFTQNATFPLRYRKIGNIVYLKGSVDLTSPPGIGVTVCTLPVGYRPSLSETHYGLWITGADFTCSLRSIGVATTGVVSLVFSYQLTTVTPSGAGNISFNTSFPVA